MKKYLLILAIFLTALSANAQKEPRRYLGLDTTNFIPKLFHDTAYTLPHVDGVYFDGNGNFSNIADSFPKTLSLTTTGRPPATYTNTTGAFRIPANGSLYATTAGTNTNFTATIPGVVAYDSGLVVNIIFNASNIGAATLNINGLGAVTIKKNVISSLVNGDITIGQCVILMYDGTFFQAQRWTLSTGYGVLVGGNNWSNDQNVSGGALTGLYHSGGIISAGNASMYVWSTTGNTTALPATNPYFLENSIPAYGKVSIGGYIGDQTSIPTNTNFAGLYLPKSAYRTVAGRTYPIGANLMVLTPRDSAASTVTDFQCVYVGDAPTTGVNNNSINAGTSKFRGPIQTKGYTVATLPTGRQGDEAFVTDATAPTYLGTLTGGGAVVCPVFYNGTAWISH